ncbi:LysR family transcriptional regulator [Garciella nitratireducens]|uniref:ModE molybdate transport repressor domain-containing protein n=1 Tax=Garciella nitratireducens DSM 15102 TaxID=1121911 RepID=A0A1T4L284_9FIRM|nr:LysR family transcriptional regulator [Garciella nitratireducens]SJZ48708.1 ModE molybdate transport repressor domain-containing protein [Garciella nitratireducens DSM 15102]
MNIEYLKYFYQVATMGSISKVAKEAHISQSALSQQIFKLEEILGCQLLERSNKGVELTSKGKIVLKYVENILKTYDTMLEHLYSDNESTRIIKIEACWPIATYSLPCVMYKMKNKFPKHNYQLNPNESDRIEENILNDICDLGVIYKQPKNPELCHYIIGKDQIVLVAPFKYQIPQEIELKDLIKYSFILLNDKNYVIDPIKSEIKKIGLRMEDFKILYHSDSVESVKSSILNQFGLGFLPYTSIKKELYHRQLKIVDIKGFSVECDMHLIYHKEIKKNPSLNEFIQYFKKIAQRSLC